MSYGRFLRRRVSDRAVADVGRRRPPQARASAQAMATRIDLVRRVFNHLPFAAATEAVLSVQPRSQPVTS
jgi:hypothetical protein